MSWKIGSHDMREAVIVSAVRTPTGKFLGGLKDLSATELGALVVREAVCRARIDPATVDECIMGNVVSGGVGHQFFPDLDLLDGTLLALRQRVDVGPAGGVRQLAQFVHRIAQVPFRDAFLLETDQERALLVFFGADLNHPWAKPRKHSGVARSGRWLRKSRVWKGSAQEN